MAVSEPLGYKVTRLLTRMIEVIDAHVEDVKEDSGHRHPSEGHTEVIHGSGRRGRGRG